MTASTSAPQRRTAATACRICAVACGTFVELEGDDVVRVTGDLDDPWSQGYTCSKGRAGPEFHRDPSRLDVPQIRRNGQLVDASWDETLDDIAARLGARHCRARTLRGGQLHRHRWSARSVRLRDGPWLLPRGRHGSDVQRTQHRLFGQVPGARARRRCADAVPTRPGQHGPAAGHRREHRGVARPWADDAQSARAPARPARSWWASGGRRSATYRNHASRRRPPCRQAGHRSRAPGLRRAACAAHPAGSCVPRRVRRRRQRRAASCIGRAVHRRAGG